MLEERFQTELERKCLKIVILDPTVILLKKIKMEMQKDICLNLQMEKNLLLMEILLDFVDLFINAIIK